MDAPIKSTLSDIVKGLEKSHLRADGLEYVQSLESEIPVEDFPIIFYYFREPLWLMRCGMYDFANLVIIITIEDCLRKKPLPKMDWEKESTKDDKLEDMPLGPLWKMFKEKYPAESQNIVSEIEHMLKVRSSFVHWNMKNAVHTVILPDSKILADDETRAQYRSSVGTIQGHEIARVTLKGYPNLSAKLLKDGIKIVKSIFPNEVLGLGFRFDEVVEDTKKERNFDF